MKKQRKNPEFTGEINKSSRRTKLKLKDQCSMVNILLILQSKSEMIYLRFISDYEILKVSHIFLKKDLLFLQASEQELFLH